jgi:hypothetical protein
MINSCDSIANAERVNTQMISEKSLGDSEREAHTVLAPQLKEHISATERSLNLIATALNIAAGPPRARIQPALKATSMLMAQMLNHLRCSMLLSLRGYSAQVCVLTASIYEAAFAVMAIGSDDQVATKWLEHDDPNRSYGEIRRITKAGLVNVIRLSPAPDKIDLEWQTEMNYVVYRQLCWAKHLNPMFVRQYSRRDSGRGPLFNGPDASEEGLKLASFALGHGAAHAASACAVYFSAYVPSELRTDLIRDWTQLSRDLSSLRERSLKRWGTKNPFPQKWRV